MTPGLARTRVFRRTSLKSNIFANYLGKGWEAVMGLAFVPLYIAYLGPEAYGIVGIVALVQAFMGILDLGMTPTLTRETARYGAGAFDATRMKDLLRSIECVTFAISAAILVAIALASTVIAQDWVRAEALPEDTIAAALSIAAAVIAMRFFETIYRGSLYGLQRQLLCNGIAAAMATLRGGGAVLLLAQFDVGLRGFFIWQAIVSALTIIAMGASVYLALPATGRGGRFSRDALASVWRFAAGMLAISLLSLAVTQADKVALSRLVPLAEFGYYVFAAKVASALTLVSSPILTALYPQLVGHASRADQVQLVRTFHRFAKIITCITAPTAALMVFFAQPLIYMWAGSEELAANAAPLLSVIAVGTFLHAQCVLPYQLQLAHGWTSLAVWANAAALVLIVPAIIWIVPVYGTIGVAWAWVAVAGLYFFGALQVMFGRIVMTERWPFFIFDVALPATAAFAVAYAAATLLIFPAEGRLFVLLYLGAVFAASLGAACASAYAILIIERRSRFITASSTHA